MATCSHYLKVSIERKIIMTEKVMYQRLLNNLTNIKNDLYNAIQNLESAESNSYNAINVSNNPYKKREIKNALDELRTQYNNLQNIYIQEVKRKMMEANND